MVLKKISMESNKQRQSKQRPGRGNITKKNKREREQEKVETQK